MPEISLDIGGRSYRVACEAGQEPQLQAAARLLDAEAKSLARAIGPAQESRILLLAGLMLADRLGTADQRARAAEDTIRAAEARMREAEARAREALDARAAPEAAPEPRAAEAKPRPAPAAPPRQPTLFADAEAEAAIDLLTRTAERLEDLAEALETNAR